MLDSNELQENVISFCLIDEQKVFYLIVYNITKGCEVAMIKGAQTIIMELDAEAVKDAGPGVKPYLVFADPLVSYCFRTIEE